MTSVLSTKWKYLWTSITNLEFDCDYVMYRTKRTEVFKTFVTRVLLLCDKSCLQSFRLKCRGWYPESFVNEWIASILSSSHIQEIDLSIPTEHPLLLPSNIFCCKTLVVLKLDAIGKVNLPASICLPILKTLHLNKVVLSDEGIVSLMSGCPVLEELKLDWCIEKDVKVINIVSPTLITLSFKRLPYDWRGGGVRVYRIILDTPSLKYINLSDSAIYDFDVKSMHHLVTAAMDIGIEKHKALTNLFIKISQVQRLCLSNRSMNVINWSHPLFPEFTNLKHMEFNMNNDIGWDPLATLLEKSPSLQTLHLIEEPFQDLKNSPSNVRIVPSCFDSHLKLIEVRWFHGLPKEMKMVKYILKNAKVLEKLTLHYTPKVRDSDEESSFYKKLVMLPRSSPICKVEVV